MTKAVEIGRASKHKQAGTPAIVQRVFKNGVRIAYEGRGIRRGEYLHKTVSAKHLEVR